MRRAVDGLGRMGWRGWSAVGLVAWLGLWMVWLYTPVIQGEPPKWLTVGWVFALVGWGWFASRGLAEADPTSGIIVDGSGVQRSLSPGRSENVAWSDLTGVHVVTTAGGPFREDVFILLDGPEGKGCALPHGAVVALGLLEHLQRLPGFDNFRFIEAMGSTDKGLFTVWTGEAGAGKVVGDAIHAQATQEVGA